MYLNREDDRQTRGTGRRELCPALRQGYRDAQPLIATASQATMPLELSSHTRDGRTSSFAPHCESHMPASTRGCSRHASPSPACGEQISASDSRPTRIALIVTFVRSSPCWTLRLCVSLGKARPSVVSFAALALLVEEPLPPYRLSHLFSYTTLIL
jgi:hypothetical protein